MGKHGVAFEEKMKKRKQDELREHVDRQSERKQPEDRRQESNKKRWMPDDFFKDEICKRLYLCQKYVAASNIKSIKTWDM